MVLSAGLFWHAFVGHFGDAVEVPPLMLRLSLLRELPLVLLDSRSRLGGPARWIQIPVELWFVALHSTIVYMLVRKV